MSRKFAAFLEAVVEGLNGLQPERQRWKSRAALMSRLEARGALAIESARGTFLFHAARGRHALVMAERMLLHEPETIQWIETYIRPGQVLWDVGAAIGAYAMYAARGGAKAVAFEPKATSYGLITEHLHLNRLGGEVTAYNLALLTASLSALFLLFLRTPNRFSFRVILVVFAHFRFSPGLQMKHDLSLDSILG